MASSAARRRRRKTATAVTSRPSGSTSLPLQRRVDRLTARLNQLSVSASRSSGAPPGKRKKKRNKAKKKSQPLAQKQGLLPVGSTALPLRHLATLMHKPLPSPVRSRLETLRYRGTFVLATSSLTNAPAYRYPMILFRPDTHLSASMIFTGARAPPGTNHADWSTPINTLLLSGQTDATTIPNWVDDFVGTVGMFFGTGEHGETMPTPNALLSDRVRPGYGVARLRVSCGPTVRGSIVYRLLNSSDTTRTPGQIYDDLDSMIGTHRLTLRPGVQTYDFVCPVDEPWREQVFKLASTSTSLTDGWLAPIAISFRSVLWNSSVDLEPQVEYSTVHTVCCELPPAQQHLSNLPPRSITDNREREIAVGEVGAGGVLMAMKARAGQAAIMAYDAGEGLGRAVVPAIMDGAVLAAA